jgi:hypothetical protein
MPTVAQNKSATDRFVSKNYEVCESNATDSDFRQVDEEKHSSCVITKRMSELVLM